MPLTLVVRLSNGQRLSIEIPSPHGTTVGRTKAIIEETNRNSNGNGNGNGNDHETTTTTTTATTTATTTIHCAKSPKPRRSRFQNGAKHFQVARNPGTTDHGTARIQSSNTDPGIFQ